MNPSPTEACNPIHVIVFGSGPILEQGVKQFLVRLEQHPQIDFLGGFFQAKAQSWPAVAADLWRRRRWLALPLLGQLLLEAGGRYVTEPRREVALNRAIRQMSSRLNFWPDIHAREVLDHVRRLAPDLGLIYGSPILKPKLFEIPRCGTLGIHHGQLPQYRGKKTLFWALYNGEKAAGVTIQQINAGLDTGRIVKEAEVAVGNRGQRAVWRDLERLGLELYLQAIMEVRDGTAVYRSPNSSPGKLYRDPKLKDILTLWQRQWQRRLRLARPEKSEPLTRSI